MLPPDPLDPDAIRQARENLFGRVSDAEYARAWSQRLVERVPLFEPSRGWENELQSARRAAATYLSVPPGERVSVHPDDQRNFQLLLMTAPDIDNYVAFMRRTSDAWDTSRASRAAPVPLKERANEPAANSGVQPSVLPFNGMAIAGLVLGLTSILFYQIGIIPILAIVFSAIALGTFKVNLQRGRWMAGVGLFLGVLYAIAYLRAYGYI